MATPAYVPAILEFSIASFISPSPNSFVWRDGKVHFTVQDRVASPRAAEPSQAHWEAFWLGCSDIGVWDLPKRIGPPAPRRLPLPKDTTYRVTVNLEHAGRTLRFTGNSGQFGGRVATRVVKGIISDLHALFSELVGVPPPE